MPWDESNYEQLDSMTLRRGDVVSVPPHAVQAYIVSYDIALNSSNQHGVCLLTIQQVTHLNSLTPRVWDSDQPKIQIVKCLWE